MLGLSLGVTSNAALAIGATPIWSWRPDLLFQPGDRGALLDPARADLRFQDAAGTTPAALAGQPVGLLRRAGGTLDASQAVSAARPTLARWPRGGRRNLAVGAQAVDGTGGYWAASATRQGITATRLGHGVEGSVPYADYRFHGTSTTGVLNDLFFGSQPTMASSVGQTWTCSATARVIAGALPAGTTLKTRVSYYTGATWGAGPASPGISDLSQDTLLRLTSTQANAAYDGVRGDMVFSGSGAGLACDVTIRIKGLQFEASTSVTGLQYNLGLHDVTEPGIPDVWHLYNDGIDDRLLLALPAGSHSLAWADPLGVTTFLSGLDAAAAANILRGPRVAAALVISRALTGAEQTLLNAHWARQIGGQP